MTYFWSTAKAHDSCRMRLCSRRWSVGRPRGTCVIASAVVWPAKVMPATGFQLDELIDGCSIFDHHSLWMYLAFITLTSVITDCGLCWFHWKCMTSCPSFRKKDVWHSILSRSLALSANHEAENLSVSAWQWGGSCQQHLNDDLWLSTKRTFLYWSPSKLTLLILLAKLTTR